MPIGSLVAVGLTVISAFGGRSWHRRVKRRRVRRELAKPPALGTTTPEGAVVRVTGTVRAVDELLVAPLSGRPCVLYRSFCSVPGGPAIGDSRFMLDTAEGPVLVDSQHALLDIDPQRRLRVTKERREQFRLRMGVAVRSRVTGYEEYVVSPGDSVAVVGLMMLDPASEPPVAESGFREDPPPERRLTGNAEHPIVVGKVG